MIELKAELDRLVDAIVDNLFQPKKNNLIPQPQWENRREPITKDHNTENIALPLCYIHTTRNQKIFFKSSIIVEITNFESIFNTLNIYYIIDIVIY